MSTHRPVKARSFDQIVTSRASAKLEEGNVKGAVRLLCSNDKLATPNVQSFNQLLHSDGQDTILKIVFLF